MRWALAEVEGGGGGGVDGGYVKVVDFCEILVSKLVVCLQGVIVKQL